MRPLSVITKVSIAGPGSASEASHISPRESDKSLRSVHQEGISSRIHRGNAPHSEVLGSPRQTQASSPTLLQAGECTLTERIGLRCFIQFGERWAVRVTS